MKRLLLIMIAMLFITGCNTNVQDGKVLYELDIKKSFKEKITIPLDKEGYDNSVNYTPNSGSYTSFEYYLLNEEIYPINTYDDIIYNKKIQKEDDKTVIFLDYNYAEKDFLHESYIYKCFENYNVKSEDDYFEVTLSGKFYCLHDFDQVEISVNTKYDALETDGVSSHNNYSWIINKDNYEQTDIHLKLARDYKNMKAEVNENEGSGKEIVIILLVLAGTGIAFYKFRKRK